MPFNMQLFYLERAVPIGADIPGDINAVPRMQFWGFDEVKARIKFLSENSLMS